VLEAGGIGYESAEAVVLYEYERTWTEAHSRHQLVRGNHADARTAEVILQTLRSTAVGHYSTDCGPTNDIRYELKVLVRKVSSVIHDAASADNRCRGQ
jgi:hypothetical protein